VVAVKRLKLCLLVLAGGLGLLALAALIVLTNTVALVITLAILATIIFLLVRRGLAEARRRTQEHRSANHGRCDNEKVVHAADLGPSRRGVRCPSLRRSGSHRSSASR
jgi:membrane protein implicated in regulation of membrane protease activity